MEKTKKPKNAAMTDALKVAMPIVAPFVTKLIIDMIPAGSKLEDILEKYGSYWDKIVPVATTLILQLTNMPDMADEILAEVGAEVVRLVKEKYSKDAPEVKKIKVGESFFPISSVMATAEQKELIDFMALIQSVSQKQRRSILEYGAKDEKNAKKIFSNLALMTEAQFKDWAEIMFPTEAPKTKSELEQNLAKSMEELKRDTNNFFDKETWLEKIALKAKQM